MLIRYSIVVFLMHIIFSHHAWIFACTMWRFIGYITSLSYNCYQHLYFNKSNSSLVTKDVNLIKLFAIDIWTQLQSALMGSLQYCFNRRLRTANVHEQKQSIYWIQEFVHCLKHRHQALGHVTTICGHDDILLAIGPCKCIQILSPNKLRAWNWTSGRRWIH